MEGWFRLRRSTPGFTFEIPRRPSATFEGSPVTRAVRLIRKCEYGREDNLGPHYMRHLSYPALKL